MGRAWMHEEIRHWSQIVREFGPMAGQRSGCLLESLTMFLPEALSTESPCTAKAFWRT